MSTVNTNVRVGHKDTTWFTTEAARVLLNGQLVVCSDGANKGKYIIGDGVTAVSGLTFYGGVSTAPTWGAITGTITNQTDLTTYLSTNYQPLDSDLTSWAGVTRAAGFDTFVTIPSSANLASLVTDETGSGSLVFGTSPTFTTNITTPSIVLSGNISAASWTTSGINIKESVRTFTNTTSSGTVANTYTNVWGGNNIVSSSATTYTNYYANYFKAEVQSTGSTITNNWAAGFSGGVEINGQVNIIGGTTLYLANTSGINIQNVGSDRKWASSRTGGNTVFINHTTTAFQFYNNDLGAVLFSINTSTGGADIYGNLTMLDAKNIVVNTGTGTKIGTGTTQKIGFWNATPIVQPTTAVTAATIVGGAGTTVKEDHTFDGYTVAQVVKALRNAGLLA